MHAALAIIGRDGIQKLTIRNLAAEARVNIASINYHFQSKENIVKEAILIQFSGFGKLITILDDKGISPGNRLCSFFDAFMERMFALSGIMSSSMELMSGKGMAKFRKPPFLIDPGAESGEFSLVGQIARQFAQISQAVGRVVSESTGLRDIELVGFKTAQLMMSINNPLLMSGRSELLLGFDIRDEATRKRYIRSVVAGIARISPE